MFFLNALLLRKLRGHAGFFQALFLREELGLKRGFLREP
jgi:hypothetical protein